MERDDFTCQNEFVGFDGCLNRGPFSAYKRQYRLHKQRQTVIIPHQKKFSACIQCFGCSAPLLTSNIARQFDKEQFFSQAFQKTVPQFKFKFSEWYKSRVCLHC